MEEEAEGLKEPEVVGDYDNIVFLDMTGQLHTWTPSSSQTNPSMEIGCGHQVQTPSCRDIPN